MLSVVGSIAPDLALRMNTQGLVVAHGEHTHHSLAILSSAEGPDYPSRSFYYGVRCTQSSSKRREAEATVALN